MTVRKGLRARSGIALLLAFALMQLAVTPAHAAEPVRSAGYWLVGGDGGVFPFGHAAGYGSLGNVHLNRPIVDAAATPTGHGYWLVASDGGIFPFGDAGGFGSTGNLTLPQPIVRMAVTASGHGYWLVGKDGAVYPFGDATGFGSLGGVRLNQPIVGIAATPDGGGYWLVAADGGIFPFGDAGGYGSTGGVRLNKPIVAMAATPTGHGYWLVGSDGAIFPFGDAAGYGSTGNVRLNRPIVDMAITGDGRGYWLVASDGGIFPFGDAAGYGSTGGTALASPIVAMMGDPLPPPVAAITGPASVSVGVAANYNASTSTTADSSTPITAYHWDFGDGSTFTSAGATTGHTFTNAGPHTVSVTVTDAYGSSAPASVTTTATGALVTITGAPPEGGFSAASTSVSFTINGGQGQPTCSLDGRVLSSCTSPTLLSALTAGSHTFQVLAVGQSQQVSQASRSWTVDSQPPTVSLTGPTKWFTLRPTASPTWTGVDLASGAASGLSWFGARYRSAAFSTSFGPTVIPSGWQPTTATSKSLTLSRGKDYCFSVVATDHVGNTSAWSAERCVTLALDDRDLKAGTGWTRGTSVGRYRGTFTSSRSHGAMLSLAGVQATKYALLATTCSSCGVVGIYSGSVLLAKISLHSASTVPSRTFAFSHALTGGTLKIVVLSQGQQVAIDGIAVARA